MRKQRILWDMDGVLSNLIGSLIDFLNQKYPDAVYEAKHAIMWNFWENLVNREAGEAVLAQMHSLNFFANLNPYPEAVAVFKQMVALGHDVAICTAPLAGEYREQSMVEKLEWIKKHLGAEFTDNILFSYDK